MKITLYFLPGMLNCFTSSFLSWEGSCSVHNPYKGEKCPVICMPHFWEREEKLDVVYCLISPCLVCSIKLQVSSRKLWLLVKTNLRQRKTTALNRLVQTEDKNSYVCTKPKPNTKAISLHKAHLAILVFLYQKAEGEAVLKSATGREGKAKAEMDPLCQRFCSSSLAVLMLRYGSRCLGENDT